MRRTEYASSCSKYEEPVSGLPGCSNTGMDSENKGSGSQEKKQEEDDFGIAEILPQYFALCQRDLLNLQAALDQHDFEIVRVLGHNLKGSGGAYGFPELSDIGSSLEASAKAQDTSVAKTGVDRLADFLSTRAPKG